MTTINKDNFFYCEFCDKKLSSKRNCIRHMDTCKIKKQNFEKDFHHIQNENRSLKQSLNEKDEENKLLKQLLNEKDEQIKLLKSLLENKSSNTTIINNNYKTNSNSNNSINTVNNIVNSKISSLEPIDFEEMKQMFEEKFSAKYIDKGIEGLANFLCEVPCNNKIITTDFSRKLVKYKNSENQVIDDPKANILLKTAIKQNADTIIDKAEDRYQYWRQQIKDAREDDVEPDETDIKNRNHTKNLKTIATKAKNDMPVKLEEATNVILMKGMENKNNIAGAIE